MSDKSDFFFLTIKQVYPNFRQPSDLETEIWEEVLEPYDEDSIRDGIKSYRKNVDTGFAPTPAKFREFLFLPVKKRAENELPELPLSPESYLMDEDIKAGKCKYFFSTYVKAVAYVFDVKVKEISDPEEYKKYTRGMKYRIAVDKGLFADFDQILDKVYKTGC
ncbi:MAG: hypothetical protein NC218_08755 [Acetobacter sp.]|nr:hypothetical protein [Acetobacter sp.]